MPNTTKGYDIYNVVNLYLINIGLNWNICVGICTDSTPSMKGILREFVSFVKDQNPTIIYTHLFFT